MNKLIFNIYRIIVPKPVRTMIVMKSIRKKILDHYSSLPVSETDNETDEVLTYLKSNPLAIFPYQFRSKYKPEDIKVFMDADRKMHYVLLDGKRLYFKKRWGVKRVARGFSDLQMEQDTESPHRYMTDEFSISGNDVIADIGAAEGNFSLSVIEKVKKIYIFEYNTQWAEALRATFEPWKEKVEIINKMVADFDDDTHTRFDTFFNRNREITFLKIDVDGAESQVLKSCESLFGSAVPLRIALCTYHKNDDEKEFTSILENHGFKITPSKGYMVHYYDKEIKAPWLRRGLIRAVKS